MSVVCVRTPFLIYDGNSEGLIKNKAEKQIIISFLQQMESVLTYVIYTNKKRYLTMAV